MTYDSRILPAVCYQFALACNLTTVFYMLSMSDGLPGWFFPQVLLLYAPGIYLLNRIFLRRERSMLALCGLNGALAGAVIAACLLLETWPDMAHFAFAAFFLGWLTYRGCCCATDGVPLPGALLVLDAAFVLMVSFVCYSSAMALPTVWSIPAAAGLCAAVAATVILRSNRSPGLKGWLAAGGAFAILLALLQVVSGAAAPAGRGLVAVWKLIAQGYNAVTGLILRFFLFLLSILPNEDAGEFEGPKPWESVLTEPRPEQESSPILGAILFLIFAVGLLVGAIWLILQLRRIRLRPAGGTRPVTPSKRERISFLPAILRLLKGWHEAIRLRLFLWRHRNSPRGLYFLLVHRCRRAPWHKRPGESPRQFLARLSQAAAGDEKLSCALTDLAAETDTAFYAPHCEEKRLEYAPLIRRRMGAALGRHFVRQAAGKLSPKTKSL